MGDFKVQPYMKTKLSKAKMSHLVLICLVSFFKFTDVNDVFHKLANRVGVPVPDKVLVVVGIVFVLGKAIYGVEVLQIFLVTPTISVLGHFLLQSSVFIIY